MERRDLTQPVSRSTTVIARSALFILVAISVLDLVGWVFAIPILESIEPRGNSMRVVTTLCLIMCAAALALIHGSPTDSRKRLAAALLAATASLVGLLTICVYLFVLRYRVESDFTNAPLLSHILAPGKRTAFWTAGILLLNGCGLTLLAIGGSRAARVAHAIALPAALASYLIPISYLLRVESIHALLGVPEAMTTGLAFCALSVAIFYFWPSTWLMSVFTGEYAGGVMARRLFPALLLIPVVIGWLRLYGERRAIFDSEAGVVLVALIYTVCLLCFLWLTARSANRTDRRRLTNAVALQESERRFVTTLASLGDAVIATEADGRITFLNRVAEELTGWSQHQAKGRSIQEVFKTIDEQTGQQAEDIAGRVLDEGLVIQLAEHMALVRRDGRVVPIEDSAAPIVDDTGQVNGVVLVFRDVTQSRLAQAALRESEAHFRALTEALPQIVWTADASGGVEWFSQHWYGYTGLAQEGGTDRSWQPVVHPEDLPDRLASWQRAQRLREAYEGEYRLLRADGEYRWFLGRAWPLYDTTGNIVRWIGTDTDIQDRKLAEAVLNRSRSELEKLVRERTAVLESVNRDLTRTLDELRATQAAVAAEQRRFREVLESLPVFVTLLTPNHEITFANRLFRERFGDPTGRCCFEFLLGLAAPCADCRATRVLKTMESYSEEWTGPDGRSYEIANFLHVDSDGTSLVMKVGIDITDRRRVEEELRSLNVKLEQRATQLRALTTELAQAEDRERRRLAEILHDHLQQLLVATRFNADTLYRTVNDESRRKIAGRMLEMLDQAIAASRTLTIELSPPVLQDSGLTAGLTWLAGWMESNHDFKVDVVAMTPVDDLADEQRLLFFQAVRELLFNAVKHSGVHHARVELETGSPDGVRVTVSDKGRGFAAEAQESAGSFGLLNIRERFAYFDGEMTIDSGIGKGTRVVLTAPARRVARLESNPPSAPTFRVLPTANP